MGSLQPGQVEMFVNITGATEGEAREKLQAFKGDINAAIDSFLTEREGSVAPVRIEERDTSNLIDEDERPTSHQIATQPFYTLPSEPTWSRGFGFDGMIASRFPYRGTSPVVTQPRDIREIPIDWKDEEPRIRSNAGLIIEEIPATAEAWPPSQLQPPIVSDDEDVSRPLFRTVRRDESRPRSSGSLLGSDFNMRQRNANGPLVDEVTDGMTDNIEEEMLRAALEALQKEMRQKGLSEGMMGSDINMRQRNANGPLADEVTNGMTHDLEEEMLKAALEASQKEMTRKGHSEISSGAGMHASRSDAEDEDFARAVSPSLKTAEQEKALREGKGLSWFSELGNIQDVDESDEVSKRKGSPSARDNFGKDMETLEKALPSLGQTPNMPMSRINAALRYPVEDTSELEEQPSLRRRPGRAQKPSFTSASTGPTMGVQQDVQTAINSAEQKGNVMGNEEWGALSSEERDEAIMLEASLFGRVSDYPAALGGIAEGSDDSFLRSTRYHNDGPIQQPPSPSVIAQRLLRKQQDDEYLASLVADKEKAERVQHKDELRHSEEAEAKASTDTQKKLQRDEELLNHLGKQDLEKQKAAKQAALPEEPDMDNENAVAIMVRLPDGARQGRRFLKSEPLQCLINFIDASCGLLPGSYKLVRPFPRRAFADAECASSFQDLGLNSKYETLFLEVI